MPSRQTDSFTAILKQTCKIRIRVGSTKPQFEPIFQKPGNCELEHNVLGARAAVVFGVEQLPHSEADLDE